MAPSFAKVPGDVHGTGIATEIVSWVAVAQYFKQNDGKVD